MRPIFPFRVTRRSRAAQPVPATPTQSLRRALPWLLFSLAATMLALIGQVPAWTLAAFAICVGWRLWSDRARRPLPSLLWRMLVFLPLAGGIVATYRAHVDASSMLAFLVTLMSLKILELRTARDVTVVSLLGFFMTLSALFFSQSLALSAFLALALFGNIIALIRCHGAPEERTMWPSIRLGLGLILQALPLVVLLFLIFPRVQADFLRRLSNPNVGLTGMSDHLQPGTFGSLVQSDELAFRAQLGNGNTIGQNQLYWRAVVLEISDSAMSWRATEPPPLPQRQTLPGTVADRMEQRITVMPHGERWLFSLDRPVDVRSPSSFHAQLCATDVLRSQAPIYSKAIYSVTSDLAPDPNVRLSPERRHFFTKVPAEISERVLNLARTFRHPGASDQDVVRAALNYLGNNGFTYSLTPGELPPTNALDYFLFQSKKGFCEHYAAAFTSLMRAAGVPSRIVVGYQGGEFNAYGKYYTVRQSDAHAWSEVWFEGQGWQRIDPTAIIAPDRVSYGAQGYAALSGDAGFNGESRLDRLRKLNAPGALRWLGHNALLAWDSLDQQWNLMVLGYDTEQQLNVLQRFNLADLDLLRGTVLTLGAAFTTLAVGMAGMRFVTRGRVAPVPSAVRLYGRFCRRVASAGGVTRRANEGPLDFARRASAALPKNAEDIRRITALYVRLRYAPDSDAASAQPDLAREVRRFQPTAAPKSS